MHHEIFSQYASNNINTVANLSETVCYTKKRVPIQHLVVSSNPKGSTMIGCFLHLLLIRQLHSAAIDVIDNVANVSERRECLHSISSFGIQGKYNAPVLSTSTF
jgi:hypothetical protein